MLLATYQFQCDAEVGAELEVGVYVRRSKTVLHDAAPIDELVFTIVINIEVTLEVCANGRRPVSPSPHLAATAAAAVAGITKTRLLQMTRVDKIGQSLGHKQRELKV